MAELTPTQREVLAALVDPAVPALQVESVNPTAPFGGVGQSGYGRELGPLGIEEFAAITSPQL